MPLTIDLEKYKTVPSNTGLSIDLEKYKTTSTPQPIIQPTQQAIPAQPEEQKQSKLDWWVEHVSDPVLGAVEKIDKPMLGVAQKLTAVKRQLFHLVPKATDLQNAVANNNYGQISRWYQDGKMLTKDQIRSQLDPQEAESLINTLNSKSKGKIFSEQGTAFSRGVLVPAEGESTIGKLGAGFYNLLQSAVSPEQVLVPSQIAIGLATLGLGSRIAGPLVETTLKRELSGIVKAGKMTPVQAKDVLKEYRLFYSSPPDEVIRALRRADIPKPYSRVPTSGTIVGKPKPTVSTEQRAGIEYAPTGEEIRTGKKTVAPVRGAVPAGTQEPTTQLHGVEQVQPLVKPSVEKPTFRPTPPSAIKTQAERDQEFADIFPDLAEKTPEPSVETPPEQKAVETPKAEEAIPEKTLSDLLPEVIKNDKINLGDNVRSMLAAFYETQYKDSTFYARRKEFIDQIKQTVPSLANKTDNEINKILNYGYSEAVNNKPITDPDFKPYWDDILSVYPYKKLTKEIPQAPPEIKTTDTSITQPINDKYYRITTIRGSGLPDYQEIKGTPVKNNLGLDLFYYKVPNKQDYVILDGKTGLDLYRTSKIGDIKEIDTILNQASIDKINKSIENGYISPRYKATEIPKTEETTPVESQEIPKPSKVWELTPEELQNLDFPVPEGGSSKTPKRVFEWKKEEEQYETLHSMVMQGDQYNINELLGKNYREVPNTLALLPRIKADKPIKVYRAIENDFDDYILPGAYVTESKAYAKAHGDNILQGNYKIVESEVKPSELMTYGDAHEFIYIPETPEIAVQRLKDHAIKKGDLLPQEQAKPTLQGAVPKEPYEMTLQEFKDSLSSFQHAAILSQKGQSAGKLHEEAVIDAVLKGKQVPDNVLADYPDLAKATQETPPSATPKTEPPAGEGVSPSKELTKPADMTDAELQAIVNTSKDDYVRRNFPPDIKKVYNNPISKGTMNISSYPKDKIFDYLMDVRNMVRKHAPNDVANTNLANEMIEVDFAGGNFVKASNKAENLMGVVHNKIGRLNPTAEEATHRYARMEAEKRGIPIPDKRYTEIGLKVPEKATTPQPKVEPTQDYLKSKEATPEAPKVSPDEANISLETTKNPIGYVKTDEIATRPKLMQFKQIEDIATGTNKADTLKGQWDDLKGGNVLLWQPKNPAEYGLAEGEKYIVANGHHRFAFGKEQGVKELPAQILKEADGYSAEDARRIAAEVNITEGKGSAYDKVKYLREQITALGKDEALGAGERIGAKGKQAVTIATNAKDDLYSAFINEDITPEQTEIIAQTAPNDEMAQRFGIKQALAGKQGYELQNIIKASQVERSQRATEGKTLDLFGQDDSAFQKMEAMSKVATEYPKQIREQLRTIQGAGKRPDIARQFGVDVNDPMGLQSAIDKMKYDLQRWENWSQHPDLVEKVRAKYEANEAVNYKQETLDLGAKGESGDPVAMANKKLTDFVDKHAEEVGQNIEDKAPKGGLGIHIIKNKGGNKLPKDVPIANQELAETLATGEKSRYGRAKEAINNSIKTAWANITVKFEARLMESAKEFLEAVPQFRDNIRTQLIPLDQRSMEAADKALYAVWGDVTGQSRKWLMRMIGLRAMKSRRMLGLSTQRDIKLDVIQTEIDNLTGILNKTDEGKMVLERVERFKDLMRNVGETLVSRGKLKLEVLDAQDFYFPFTPKEYFQNYTSLGRKAQRRFRGYTLAAQGTKLDVVMTEDAARMYVAQVHIDNGIDDFTINNLSQFDVYGKTLSSGKTDDELTAIFRNEDHNISPNRIYKIDGKLYKAYQEIPGNIKYVGDTVNVKKLVEEDIPDIIAQGENISNDEILDRLESLRKGLIMGSKNRSYLIPLPIAERLSRLKEPYSEMIPGVDDLRRMTRMWKGATLTYAGLPYQTLNIAGDMYNVYITSSGALNPITVKQATRILEYIKHPAKHGPNYLTSFEKDVLRIAQEKDVLGSGFMSEWRSASRPLKVPGWQNVKTKWERFNYTRESIPKLIEMTYQWDRHVKGKGFVGEAFKKDIAHLDPESAAAFISRNATIDYRAVPEWYRRNMNGLLFPFLTWSQKNIINMAKQFKTPIGALKMGLKVGVPFAAAYVYNNTGDRKYIYDRLGYFQNRSSTMIIKGEDLDDDGKPEQAWVFSPQMPWDSATEIMGWSKILPLINQVQRGLVTPEDAAKTFIYGLGAEPTRHLLRMTTPFAQFLIGAALDKDPVDKQPIIPQSLKNIKFSQKIPYWRNYLLEKMASPFGQYIRLADKGEATNAYGLLSKGPFDWVRAFGLYKVNLVSNEAKELLSLATKEQAQHAFYLYKYKQAYIEGDKEKQANILKEASDKGYVLSGKSLASGIKSDTVQKKRLLHQMSESDQGNYLMDMVDDMTGDDKVKSLMNKITSPKITKEQKQDYQNTLDAKLYKDALKLAMKSPNLMKRLKSKESEPVKPAEPSKSIGRRVGLEILEGQQ